MRLAIMPPGHSTVQQELKIELELVESVHHEQSEQLLLRTATGQAEAPGVLLTFSQRETEMLRDYFAAEQSSLNFRRISDTFRGQAKD